MTDPFADEDPFDSPMAPGEPLQDIGIGHNSGVIRDFTITRDQVTESLYWLAENAAEVGIARGRKVAAEEIRKIRKSQARVRAREEAWANSKKLSAADLDDLAYTDPEYVAYVNGEYAEAHAVDATFALQKAFHESRLMSWHQQQKMAQSKGNVR